MAGEALTPKFMLGSATVMIGAQEDLHMLGVGQSLGLVKNFSMKSTPGFAELSQGVKNSLVASIQNKNDVMCDMESYEYTAKNLTYAVSLDGSEVVSAGVASTTTAALTPTGGPPAVTPAIVPVVSATGMTAGKFLMVHANSGDQIFMRRIVSVASLNVTVNAGFPVTIPSGAKVSVVSMVPVGSTKDNPYLAAKVVGQLADNSWIGILLPKIRITSGISLGFKTDNFDNNPMQFTVYDLTAADPNYSDFVDTDGSIMKAQIFLP